MIVAGAGAVDPLPSKNTVVVAAFGSVGDIVSTAVGELMTTGTVAVVVPAIAANAVVPVLAADPVIVAAAGQGVIA